MPATKTRLTGMQQIGELKSLRQNAAAYLLGISVRRLRDHDAPRQLDGTYSGAELYKWSLERMVDMDESDPRMRGGSSDSTALEAYRREKAREAKRKNEEAEKRLVVAGEIANQLSRISAVFRSQAERIEQRFGLDVGKAIRDMIDNAQREWEILVSTPAEEEGQGALPLSEPSKRVAPRPSAEKVEQESTLCVPQALGPKKPRRKPRKKTPAPKKKAVKRVVKKKSKPRPSPKKKKKRVAPAGKITERNATRRRTKAAKLKPHVGTQALGEEAPRRSSWKIGR